MLYSSATVRTNSSPSLHPNILIPQRRPRLNELFHHPHALLIIEIDHVHALPAQPRRSTLEGSRLTYYHGADAELFDEPAAVPARFQRGDHDGVAVAALASGVAEGVGLAVAAGVSVLDAAVVPSAKQRAVVAEQRGADGDTPFRWPLAGLLERDLQHGAVIGFIGHVNPPEWAFPLPLIV